MIQISKVERYKIMATKKDKTIEEELANALITKYQTKTVEDRKMH